MSTAERSDPSAKSKRKNSTPGQKIFFKLLFQGLLLTYFTSILILLVAAFFDRSSVATFLLIYGIIAFPFFLIVQLVPQAFVAAVLTISALFFGRIPLWSIFLSAAFGSFLILLPFTARYNSFFLYIVEIVFVFLFLLYIYKIFFKHFSKWAVLFYIYISILYAIVIGYLVNILLAGSDPSALWQGWAIIFGFELGASLISWIWMQWGWTSWRFLLNPEKGSCEVTTPRRQAVIRFLLLALCLGWTALSVVLWRLLSS